MIVTFRSFRDFFASDIYTATLGRAPHPTICKDLDTHRGASGTRISNSLSIASLQSVNALYRPSTLKGAVWLTRSHSPAVALALLADVLADWPGGIASCLLMGFVVKIKDSRNAILALHGIVAFGAVLMLAAYGTFWRTIRYSACAGVLYTSDPSPLTSC